MIKQIEYSDRVRYVLLDDMLHRPNGPYFIHANSDWDWMLFGRCHRYYGPQDNEGGWRIHGKLVKYEIKRTINLLTYIKI